MFVYDCERRGVELNRRSALCVSLQLVYSHLCFAEPNDALIFVEYSTILVKFMKKRTYSKSDQQYFRTPSTNLIKIDRLFFVCLLKIYICDKSATYSESSLISIGHFFLSAALVLEKNTYPFIELTLDLYLLYKVAIFVLKNLVYFPFYFKLNTLTIRGDQNFT